MLALRCLVYLASHHQRKVRVAVVPASVQNVAAHASQRKRSLLASAACMRSRAFPECSRGLCQFDDIVARQRMGDASQYPLGITAINVTCMLGDVLGLR